MIDYSLMLTCRACGDELLDRSLEACAHYSQAVARHITALSTYLGHARATDTYCISRQRPSFWASVARCGGAAVHALRGNSYYVLA
jgi:hypothetical protein